MMLPVDSKGLNEGQLRIRLLRVKRGLQTTEVHEVLLKEVAQGTTVT